MQTIKGQYQHAASTEHCAAMLHLTEQGQVQLYAEHDNRLLLEATADSYKLAEVLPADNLDENSKQKIRVTTKFMTKYERARVLGARALQIRYSQFALFF